MRNAVVRVGIGGLFLVSAAVHAQEPAPAQPAIADNSFFIEEAYNQEPGVVQHISTLAATGDSNSDLYYTLTQEWPFRGQRHQLSYTIPFTRLEGMSTGLGDVLLNYRLQLGVKASNLAVAPRLSAVLPTGNVRRGLGDGTLGLQLNLPVSWQVTPAVVTHWNAGVTLLPRAQGPVIGGGRVKRTLVSYNLGASVIAPTQWPVQLMMETVANFDATIDGGGSIDRQTSWTYSPGVRLALNLGRLQIVPGAAAPFTRAAGRTESDLFLYLSFEHPFRTVEAE